MPFRFQPGFVNGKCFALAQHDRPLDDILQDSQESDLGLGRQVPDLVKEDRPAIGQLKPSQSPLERAGERALLVSEQLRGNERRRNRCAVYGDKRPGCPLRALVYGPAISSLPVPVSPSTSTVESDGATLVTWINTLRMTSDEPTISSNIEE